MRRPSYCSLSELIWNSSCLACATSVFRSGLGAMTWAALMPPGTATASMAVPEISTAARLAARLSLRTAMHDIGIKAQLPTDSVEVLPFKALTDRPSRPAAVGRYGTRRPAADVPGGHLSRWPAAPVPRWSAAHVHCAGGYRGRRHV